MRSGSDIAVVGAGPVGALAAGLLAKRGFRVRVLERRPDMRRETISAGRSINLAVSVRGLHALSLAGLKSKVLSLAIPMKGRMIHPIAGDLTFQRYGKDDSEVIYSMSRGELNKQLMTFAEDSGVESITFHRKVTGWDPKTREISFEDGEKETADIVMGADGSASAIRQVIAGRKGSVSSEVPLDYGYKELTLPAGPSGSFLLEKNALHIWPRGKFMLIALPNFDGSFTCTLFLSFHGSPSFDDLKDRRGVGEFFRAQFPDFARLLPGLEDQFMENPLGHMVTVKCFPWNWDDKALLIGDAAHAIVPFFGQGMNAGFEDVTELLGMLGQTSTPHWEEVFERFCRIRKPNADAIADMAVENFLEMRDRVGDPKFLLAKAVERIVESEFPAYVSRYRMVTFTRIPYADAKRVGEVEDRILSELCMGIEKPDQFDRALAARLVRERLAN